MGLERGWIYTCLECGQEGFSPYTPTQEVHPGCKRAWEKKQREKRKEERKRGHVALGSEVPGSAVPEVNSTEQTIPCSEIGTSVAATHTKHARIMQTQEVDTPDTPKRDEIPAEGEESKPAESRRADIVHPRRRIAVTAEVEVDADELLELLREIKTAAREGKVVSPEISRRIDELTKGLTAEQGEEQEDDPSEGQQE
jgi:hypothetical protein